MDDAPLPEQKRRKQENERKSGEFEFEFDATTIIQEQLLKFSDGRRGESNVPCCWHTCGVLHIEQSTAVTQNCLGSASTRKSAANYL
eukprot:scaffold19953_cov37-Cyclotella_meneghiniana.AAC.3